MVDKKKVECPYVGGSQADCIDADSELCKSCDCNKENRKEISFYRKTEK